MATENGTSGRLKVIIIGGGIGGLSTAAFLRQQGHTVEIYESSKFATELGAAIHIPPNAHSLLKRIGVDPVAIGANPCTRITAYTSGGYRIHSSDVTLGAKIWKDPWLLGHRVKLHNKLKDVAIASGASLHLSKAAVSIDKSEGRVAFDDGSFAQGDVIIGADGVHSFIRRQLSPDHQPFGSGKSAFRFLIPRQAVLEDPQTRPYAETDGELVMVYHSDRRMVMYPTSDNSILNFVCIHPERETSSTATGSWNNNATKSMLLEVYKDFSDDFKAILAKSSEESLRIWKLLDMSTLDTWSDGRVVLMGDAAHPFLPHQGQGGAVAIEDAAALGVLLEAGLKPCDIERRLELYTKIRKSRADKLQEYTRLAGKDLKLGEASKLNIQDYTNYNFGHDEFDNATQKLREWKWAQLDTSYWPQPTTFGPMPDVQSVDSDEMRHQVMPHYVTAIVTLKTSRTVLQNLLPTGIPWSFESPGTIATCSFVQTTYSGLSWLGGGGYDSLGLYIHGVRCQGTACTGAYVPVLFENLADSIIAGREILGLPKVYSSIEVVRSDTELEIQASWRDYQWGLFKISGLESPPTSSVDVTTTSTNPALQDEGLIFEKYRTATGMALRGEVELENATFIRFDQATNKRITGSSKIGRNAQVKFNPGNQSSLPTLHHIIKRLAEIPILEVLGATVKEGSGADFLSSLPSL